MVESKGRRNQTSRVVLKPKVLYAKEREKDEFAHKWMQRPKRFDVEVLQKKARQEELVVVVKKEETHWGRKMDPGEERRIQ